MILNQKSEYNIERIRVNRVHGQKAAGISTF